MLEFPEIARLEMTETYPEAIDALEERLRADPDNIEIVARLGFNLWYAAVEADRMGKNLPVVHYRTRFMELLREYRTKGADNSEFCWAFGLALVLFPWEFPGATEKIGDDLLLQAADLDPFWARLRSGTANQDEITLRFRNKGIFASYYQVSQ